MGGLKASLPASSAFLSTVPGAGVGFDPDGCRVRRQRGEVGLGETRKAEERDGKQVKPPASWALRGAWCVVRHGFDSILPCSTAQRHRQGDQQAAEQGKMQVDP